MVKRIWILTALSLVFLPACRAQGYGGAVAGYYGSAGTVGGGGVFVGIYGSERFPKFGNGILLEFGVTGPTRKTPVDGLFSANLQTAWNLRRNPETRSPKPGFLYLTGGYSGFFNNGNGVNYGSGFIWRLNRGKNSEFSALRLEYRETFAAGWGRQPGFRIAWESGSNLD